MKCPVCDLETQEIYRRIEHSSGGRMAGHPGLLLYRSCEQCGMKINEGHEDGEKSKEILERSSFKK